MLDGCSCVRYMQIGQQQASSVHGRQRSPSTCLSPAPSPIDRTLLSKEQGEPLQARRGKLKRTRLREDIEGDETEHRQRKKRRLRLTLVTSRLSEPYATPTTHIAGRRAVRQGIWARQRVSGRNLFRRAAILNSIATTRKSEPPTDKDGPVSTPNLLPHAITSSPPSVTKILLPVSPLPDSLLSPSDYDPFDYEEDCMEEDEEDDDDGYDDIEGTAPIYSDFNKLQEAGSEVEVCDENYSFDSFLCFGIGDRQFAEPSEKAIGLIMENEIQNEVSCAPRTE